MKLPNAKKRTIGTKTAEILSAKDCIGALDDCASSTILIICENKVSAPTFSAFISKVPEVFILGDIT